MKPHIIGLQSAVHKITRIHFAFIFLYMVTLVAFDSWNLIAHEAVVWRWQAASSLLIVNAICWYVARTTFQGKTPYKLAVMLIVVADILFISLNVYWQRGMAGKAVALFAVPILISAILHSRRAILATATLASAAYSYAAVRYFHLNYGEGYKVELYGEIALYCGMFYIFALLLMEIIKPHASAPSLKAKSGRGNR